MLSHFSSAISNVTLAKVTVLRAAMCIVLVVTATLHDMLPLPYDNGADCMNNGPHCSDIVKICSNIGPVTHNIDPV